MKGADGAAERASLISAAREVLERSGYVTLKVDAVIRAAGSSIGAFYRHFASKDELMEALLLDELKQATATLWELTSHGSPSERVSAWVDAVVSLAYGRERASRARWFTTMPTSLRDSVGRLTSVEHDTCAPVRQAIADGIAGGEFARADPERDAELIESLCSRLDEGRPPWLGADRAEGVETVADFVLAALTNPARRRSGRS